MKMWIIVTVFMGIAVTAAFVLVVVNRESEKIVNAAVPLGFATLLALGLVFAFAREEPLQRVVGVDRIDAHAIPRLERGGGEEPPAVL